MEKRTREETKTSMGPCEQWKNEQTRGGMLERVEDRFAYSLLRPGVKKKTNRRRKREKNFRNHDPAVGG